ncbi:unnamed protein product [Allacma fusca]|uniref:Uncharacterized protein n=1 Tax=Allacma fusca TaxID=39272 RepID=A0A8J2PTJ8_9HEXA|nr:unnamed protein product [Allacma fusca]
MSQLGLVTVLCLLAGSVISQEAQPSKPALPGDEKPKLPFGVIEKMLNLEKDPAGADLPKIPLGKEMPPMEIPKIPVGKTPGSEVQSDDVQISPRFLMHAFELRELNQPEDKGFSKSPYDNGP